MSDFESEKQIDNLLDAFTKADEDARIRLLEEINEEIEAFLSKESADNNAQTVFLIFWGIYPILCKKNLTNFWLATTKKNDL